MFPGDNPEPPLIPLAIIDENMFVCQVIVGKSRSMKSSCPLLQCRPVGRVNERYKKETGRYSLQGLRNVRGLKQFQRLAEPLHKQNAALHSNGTVIEPIDFGYTVDRFRSK